MAHQMVTFQVIKIWKSKFCRDHIQLYGIVHWDHFSSSWLTISMTALSFSIGSLKRAQRGSGETNKQPKLTSNHAAGFVGAPILKGFSTVSEGVLRKWAVYITYCCSP